MATYRVDRVGHLTTSDQIKKMAAALEEIAPNLQTLQDLLTEHSNAMSTPSIDEYRSKIQEMVRSSINLTHQIAQQTKQLCLVSEQAARHLLSLDEHFGTALRDGNRQAIEAPESGGANRMQVQVEQ